MAPRMIHFHYNKLTPSERVFVDAAFVEVFALAKANGVKLVGDDRVERAVDALAQAVLESRTVER